LSEVYIDKKAWNNEYGPDASQKNIDLLLFYVTLYVNNAYVCYTFVRRGFSSKNNSKQLENEKEEEIASIRKTDIVKVTTNTSRSSWVDIK
jgi:hypothetical protein